MLALAASKSIMRSTFPHNAFLSFDLMINLLVKSSDRPKPKFRFNLSRYQNRKPEHTETKNEITFKILFLLNERFFGWNVICLHLKANFEPFSARKYLIKIITISLKKKKFQSIFFYIYKRLRPRKKNPQQKKRKSRKSNFLWNWTPNLLNLNEGWRGRGGWGGGGMVDPCKAWVPPPSYI